jgi:hypothetical protein
LRLFKRLLVPMKLREDSTKLQAELCFHLKLEDPRAEALVLQRGVLLTKMI